MATDWDAANAIASTLSAITTGTLGVVAWVQAKQLAYKDLVGHYNEMASKIYPELRRRLQEETSAVTFLMGSNFGNYAGGGPTAHWWPSLKEAQPGLVHHLPKPLVAKLDQLQALRGELDQQHRQTYEKTQRLLMDACAEVARRNGMDAGDVMINLQPTGAIEGASIQKLWANNETIEQFLERTKEYRGRGRTQVALHIVAEGGNTRVLAQDDVARQLLHAALELTRADAFLQSVQSKAAAAAAVAREALAMLDREAAKVPRPGWLWPDLH